MRKVQLRVFIWLGDEKTVDQIDNNFLELILLHLLFYGTYKRFMARVLIEHKYNNVIRANKIIISYYIVTTNMKSYYYDCGILISIYRLDNKITEDVTILHDLHRIK